MAYSLSLNTLLVLLLVSIVRAGDFSYLFDLIFTKPFYSSSDVKVKKDSYFASTDPVQANSAVESAFTCSSVYMNKFSWRWLISSSNCGSYQTVTMGLWVNFQSTLSQEVMKFGNSAFDKTTYIGKSTTEGTLDFDYIDDSGVLESPSFSFNVPLNSWIFLVMKWQGGETFIIMFGQEQMTRTRTNDYASPKGDGIGFGYDVKAYLYEFTWFYRAGISDPPFYGITL
ncbi:unnamed protein product [Blepharisma stoltei]|uniref:Uncharacterized protein n=1 Tax=Blepharisma stoltei TaxID=1481888 RepID=A0AAU9J1I0_9CILI|nr:unnamed protein product [Blepharisma stoltei]